MSVSKVIGLSAFNYRNYVLSLLARVRFSELALILDADRWVGLRFVVRA